MIQRSKMNLLNIRKNSRSYICCKKKASKNRPHIIGNTIFKSFTSRFSDLVLDQVIKLIL